MKSLVAHVRDAPIAIAGQLTMQKRSYEPIASEAEADAGCVKTARAEKRLEWFFSNRPKSNKLTNSRHRNATRRSILSIALAQPEADL